MTLVRRIRCWLHDLPRKSTLPNKRPAPTSAEEAISRYLAFKANWSHTKRFTATISGIFEIGGAEGVLTWALSRIEQRIGCADEIEQLHVLMRGAELAEERAQKAHEKWIARRVHEYEYEQLWVRLLRERCIHDRAKARREAPDPRELIRRRLERTLRKPAAPTPRPRRLTAAQRMDRSWRRRKYLVAGQ